MSDRSGAEIVCAASALRRSSDDTGEHVQRRHGHAQTLVRTLSYHVSRLSCDDSTSGAGVGDRMRQAVHGAPTIPSSHSTVLTGS